MILFISAWHLVALLGLIGGLFAVPAFLAAARLWALWVGIGSDIQREQEQAEQRKRDRRSAAAKKGHVTRRAKRPLELEAEAEVERVLRAIDAQADAKQQ